VIGKFVSKAYRETVESNLRLSFGNLAEILELWLPTFNESTRAYACRPSSDPMKPPRYFLPSDVMLIDINL